MLPFGGASRIVALIAGAAITYVLMKLVGADRGWIAAILISVFTNGIQVLWLRFHAAGTGLPARPAFVLTHATAFAIMLWVLFEFGSWDGLGGVRWLFPVVICASFFSISEQLGYRFKTPR